MGCVRSWHMYEQMNTELGIEQKMVDKKLDPGRGRKAEIGWECKINEKMEVQNNLLNLGKQYIPRHVNILQIPIV